MRILLLSGGTDSTCLAYYLRPELCITFDYGQVTASREIRVSKSICKTLKLTHRSYRVNLKRFGAGIMTGTRHGLAGHAPEWWPYRNQILITMGAMIGFNCGAQELLIGCVRTDRQHKDGNPKFIRAMDKVLREQEGSMRLNAPAISLSTQKLIDVTQTPIEVLALSFSCHVSNYPCGQCRGCKKNSMALRHARKMHERSKSRRMQL